MKLDLRSSSEVRRLIGQIAAYSERATAIFVVLIDPDDNMADEVHMSLEALTCKNKVEVVYIEDSDDFDDEDEN